MKTEKFTSIHNRRHGLQPLPKPNESPAVVWSDSNGEQLHRRHGEPLNREITRVELRRFPTDEDDSLSVTSFASMCSSLPGLLLSPSISTKVAARWNQLKKTLQQRDKLRVLSSAKTAICKNARVYSHHTTQPTEIQTTFFASPTAKAIYACLLLSTTFHRVEFLYGVLLVLWIQVAWILLKWVLFIFDDPEVQNSLRFCQGWFAVVLRHGNQMVHNQSAKSWYLAGAVAKNLPSGMSVARAYLRQFTQKVNQDKLEELGHLINLRKRNAD